MTDSGDPEDRRSDSAEGSDGTEGSDGSDSEGAVPDDGSAGIGTESPPPAGSGISQAAHPDGREGQDDPREASHPAPEDLHPWLDERDGEETEDEDEPPFVVRAIGQVGIYLATVSLGLAIFGVAGIYAEFQPWGNVATTLALVGVTVAMLMGMVFQAYVGEYRIGR